MNVQQSWNLVFFVGFVVYVGIRHVFARRAMGNEKAVRQADRTDTQLLIAVIVGTLLLPILYLFTPVLWFADYRPPHFVSWCGAGVMMGALWLFWRSHADLGENWSISLELRTQHELITHGVYRWIRHPMYAAIFLFCIAQGLLLQNWLAGWSALVTFAPMYFRRAPREETMMVDYFGEEYHEYMRRTGRLFPRFGSRMISGKAKNPNEKAGTH